MSCILRQLLKVFIFSCVFFMINVFFQQEWVQASASSDSINVQINDSVIHFPDAKPRIDGSDRIQVPLRFVSERLGYTVHWKKERGDTIVTIQNGEQSIVFYMNKDTVLLNGDKVKLDSEPFVTNDRIYVPLRFIGESTSVEVKWNDEYQLAIINEDGRNHKPTVVEALPNLSTYVKEANFKATAYSASVEENGKWGAVDFLGNPLRLGTVAVDPSVIPLGTRLYITGYNFDGLPSKGLTAVATDIGSAIKGNRIDIFVPGSAEKVRNFGFQKVKLYILKNKKH